MDLRDLFRDLPVEALPDHRVEVSGLAYDSRQVKPGDLFAALPGEVSDGRTFVKAAVEAGAAAVLAALPPLESVPIPWLTTREPRKVLGQAAVRFFDYPHRDLTVIGVTGTNGKSTVVRLVESIFQAAGIPTGHLGTLGYRFGDLDFAGTRTTPEASDLYRILSEMRDAGAEAVVLEVSSHALDRSRVEGLDFNIAAFTNLTRDHLDYHGDLEHYFATKKRLFEALTPDSQAVINASDPYGQRLLESYPEAITFGHGGGVRLEEVRLETDGIRATVVEGERSFLLESDLIGRFNVENLGAAVAIATAQSLSVQAIQEGIRRVKPLAGRMEPIPNEEGLSIFVDYAHTPGALEAALSSVRELGPDYLTVVFGCGGDRDQGKRVEMGEIAGRLADFAVISSDNPRGEDPLDIIREVERGINRNVEPQYRVVPDRREAIRRTVQQLSAQGALLVAGKGHETGQIIGKETLPFNDRDEVILALEARHG